MSYYQLSSGVCRMSNLITESYSQLTDGEKIVFNILKEKNEILAKNLKGRSDDKKES